MNNFQPPDPVCMFCDDWCSGTCEGAREQAAPTAIRDERANEREVWELKIVGEPTTIIRGQISTQDAETLSLQALAYGGSFKRL